MHNRVLLSHKEGNCVMCWNEYTEDCHAKQNMSDSER